MLPFRVEIRAGLSPFRQVVYAATRAVVAGELPAGAAFPSVRELSQALKINPNTAHKVVAELVRTGILEVLPGIGTVVAQERPTSAVERRALLSRETEVLVVEAKRLGLTKEEVMAAIEDCWAALSDGASAHAGVAQEAAPVGGGRS